MPDARKKPGVAFWATVVVVVVVLYVASYGPAWWLHVRLGEPRATGNAIVYLYSPLWWATKHGPVWFQDSCIRYRFWGMNVAEAQNRQDQQN
jgi:hypothetical protein